MLDAFKNVSLLWFLPLVTLPILLHLITMYRLRTVELSTFRFLMDSYVQQRRRVRLFEWLLLLLRTLAVALVILALSRPQIYGLQWMFGGKELGEVLIVIDASPSMALRSGGTSSLERARAAAREIVNRLSADNRVTLIRAADRPQVLTRKFAVHKQGIIEQIDRIEVSAGGGDLAAALARAYPEDTADTPRRLYLLSDLNRRTWEKLAGHPVMARISAASQVAVIDVGSSEPVTNLGVTGQVPATLRPVVGLPLMLSATVVNGSKDQTADTVLSLILDEKQVQRVNLSLQPGQSVTRTFAITPDRAGTIRGKLELPHDAFRDDDTFLFCLNVQPHINVLVVVPQAAATDIEDPKAYVLAALRSPVTAAQARPTWHSRIAAALSITTITPEKLSAAELEKADTVILADVAVNKASGALLRRFVDTGGGLLILPGARVDGKAYGHHLLRAVTGSRHPGIRFGDPVGDPDDESTFATISGPNLRHPVLSAFDEEDAQFFATTRLYRYFPIVTAQVMPKNGGAADMPTPQINSLLRLSDQTTVLAETRLGSGKMLVAGFPATPDWSNLPLKPEFVPMLLRSMAYLCRPASASAPSTVPPNQPAVVRLTDRWPRAQLQVIDPTGKSHTIPLRRWRRQMIGAMQQTGATGFYTAHILPRVKGAPPRVELGFAVNLDAEQTDFTKLDDAELNPLFAPIEPVYLRGLPDDPVLAKRLDSRREIWRWLIAIMFGVIMLEFLMATLRPQTAAVIGDAQHAGGFVRRLGRRMGDMFDRTGLWIALPRLPKGEASQTQKVSRRETTRV